jgi:FkbM family methyltransferase
MSLRGIVRELLAKAGYRISRTQGGIGGSAFFDMKRLVVADDPLVFDVGANVGQSVDWFRRTFPRARIHSFEPSPAIFARLKTNVANVPNVSCWNIALGSAPADLPLNENSIPEWSSLLPSDRAWGKVEKQTMVPVRTLDDFCQEQGVAKIDVLKSDTQGYELEVFRGAERMFRQKAIGIVYCEIVFSDQYRNAASPTHLYDFLIQRGFHLVSYYETTYERGLASWTDGVFLHESYPAGTIA